MEDIKTLGEQTACVSFDCDVEELEERIAPARIVDDGNALDGVRLQNHNETMLEDRS